jgi:hypothetical protein
MHRRLSVHRFCLLHFHLFCHFKKLIQAAVGTTALQRFRIT